MDGREALSRLDRLLARQREKLSDAVSAAAGLDAREAEVRDEQLMRYRSLAEIRLAALEDETGDELDEVHARAQRLLRSHDDYVAEAAADLAAAADRIAALEAERTALAEQRDRAIGAYEALADEVEARLADDAGHTALADAAEVADAVARRSQSKLELAEAERDAKGAAYRNDPLFHYLWTRGFRTTDYEAGPVTRFLDGWVARLCGYDTAYLDYARLTDLPKWLAEHARKKAEAADAARTALEQAEARALDEAGAGDLNAAVEAARTALATVDEAIREAEAAHGELADAHARALKSEDGPARQARRILEDGLRQASFADLRALAAETLHLEDDRAVDRLVKLRAEQLSLELEAERLAGAPDRLRRDLAAIEIFRRKFKAARLDSPFASVRAAVFDDALDGLLAGAVDADTAFRRLRRSVRHNPGPPRTFGGRRRADTMGLPDILGDVAWDIARRSMSGRPARLPKWSPPRGRSKGGSGGRRGGGGFRTGGGF